MQLPPLVAARALAASEPILRSLRDVEPPALREAVEHLPRAGGKRLRPAVALLAAEAARPGDGAWERAMPVAVASELIHVFSLVHDDIMDGDSLRRGIPTVHAKWGEAVGILAGDALLAKAFEVLTDLDAPLVGPVVRLASEATRLLCAGQAMDMAFETADSLTPQDYLGMTTRKTAALFSLAAAGGAMVGGLAGNDVRPFRDYANALGIAFQLRDDVLDVTASASDMGKTAGKDVRSGKRTLLYIEARRLARGDDAAALARIVGKQDASDAEVARVVETYRSTGALATAEELTRAHGKRAEAALDTIPGSDAKRALVDLARWGATRNS